MVIVIFVYPFSVSSKGRMMLRGRRRLRDVFAKNCHPRLMKEISVNRRKAFATRAEYIAGLEAADLVKLASLIRVVGLLLQVKAYLFWQK